MRLILVRHGQTLSNVEHKLDTAVPGPPLTELGELQAEALPAALEDERIEAVFASSLRRAQMTAAPLAAQLGLPVLVRDGIREVTAGEFEMRSDVESVEGYLSTLFAWSVGDLDRRMPGGETGAETFARFDAVVAEASELETAVLVSHGGAIRMWVAGRAHNVGGSFARHHSLGNTGVIVAEGDPGSGWRVLSWTDALIADATEGPGGEPLPIGD